LSQTILKIKNHVFDFKSHLIVESRNGWIQLNMWAADVCVSIWKKGEGKEI